MVFQDFDQVQERRRAHKKNQLRKRIIFGVVLVLIILGAVAALVVYKILNGQKHNAKKRAPASSKQPPKGEPQLANNEKLVKNTCSVTDYKDRCETDLKSHLKDNRKETQPKDLLKAAIAAASDEVSSSLDQISKFDYDNDQKKAAFESCKNLMNDAKAELDKCIAHVKDTDLDKLSLKANEMKIRLSAVMSYQDACSDGFSDDQLKSKTKKTFESSRESTSNSLAIASGLSKFLQKFEAPRPNRRLLSEDGEIPMWVRHSHERILENVKDKPTPNLTVATDGSGNYKTISEALSAIPASYDGRYIIYVKEGTYQESVKITEKMVNVLMYGDGSQKTTIMGNKNSADGTIAINTATLTVLGDGFMAKSLGFKNSAGPDKKQAVAARVQSDHVIFQNCRFEGYQGTLYAQSHRQFYRSCKILGTVDIIFGDAAAVFQNCDILIRKPRLGQQNTVTAQGRTDKHETTGFVLQNCHILPDEELAPVKTQFKSYLGRPWKEYSRTIVMESIVEDVIQPQGWVEWEGDFGLQTLFYAEYKNKGERADVKSRVNWSGFKELDKNEAQKFTVASFIQGDHWVNITGAPVSLGLTS